MYKSHLSTAVQFLLDHQDKNSELVKDFRDRNVQLHKARIAHKTLSKKLGKKVTILVHLFSGGRNVKMSIDPFFFFKNCLEHLEYCSLR